MGEVKSFQKQTVARRRPRPVRQKRRSSSAGRGVAAARQKAHCDFPLLFVLLLLLMLGNLMVFSSSYYYCLTNPQKFSSMYFFFLKQLQWTIVGLVTMFAAMHVDYRLLRKLALWGYVFSILLLLLVYTPLGIEEKGSRRWLGYGTLRFQPSEVAKICVILFLAHFLVKNRKILNTFKGHILCLMIGILPAGLIALSNLSTGVIVAAITILMIFVVSPKLRHFPVSIGLLGAGGLALIKLKGYRQNRVSAWLDPFSDVTDKGYQVIQSLYAVASGGLFGLGLGQSRQKTFVPEAYNDIIFAIICEELGLFGACLVIALFAVLLWRGVHIALDAPDTYGTLVAVGITAMIGVQALINIAVVTNTIPNTGVPLPFISYGGTSLVFTMAAMGILLNISRYHKLPVA